MKNKKNLTKGAIIISGFALLAFGVLSAQAASEDDLFQHFRRGGENIGQEMRQEKLHQENRINFDNLSEEEKQEIDKAREQRRNEAEKRREEMSENRELIHTAIENNNYDAWKALAPDNCPMLDEITEENFSELKDRIGEMKNKGRGFRGMGEHGMMMEK